MPFQSQLRTTAFPFPRHKRLCESPATKEFIPFLQQQQLFQLATERREIWLNRRFPTLAHRPVEGSIPLPKTYLIEREQLSNSVHHDQRFSAVHTILYQHLHLQLTETRQHQKKQLHKKKGIRVASNPHPLCSQTRHLGSRPLSHWWTLPLLWYHYYHDFLHL